MPQTDEEQSFTGGNASGPVVRVGRTVRKLWTPASPFVHEFMHHVRANGGGAPRTYGRDESGRQSIEYIDGPLAIAAPVLTHSALRRIGAMVRAIHDASEGFTPPAEAQWETAISAPGADLICHNDLAPWNLVLGERWMFIDWDAAAPSTRLWDLAYAAQTFTLGAVDTPPDRAAVNLRAFVDGYGADADLRRRLPLALEERAAAMLALLTSAHAESREPWSSMFADGHGAHWAAVVEYVRANRESWRVSLNSR